MGLADDNIIMKFQRGRYGDQVYRHCGDHTVVSRYPDYSNMKWTDKQAASRVRFKDATDYGKKVLAIPKLKARYKKKAKPGQNAWNLAIADFMLQSKKEKIDTTSYEVLKKELFKVSVKTRILVKNRGRAAARVAELPGSAQDSVFGVKRSGLNVKG